MGARLLDTVCSLIGNEAVVAASLRASIRILKQVSWEKLHKILVVSDLNIGDAVNIQAPISVVKDYFPEAKIDYIINKHAKDLIEGNPEINRLFPVFTGSPYPSPCDFENIRRISATGCYDVILNFCPFFRRKIFAGGKGNPAVIGPATLIYMFMNSASKRERKNHVLYQTSRFVDRIFSAVANHRRVRSEYKTNVYLSDEAVENAQKFLKSEKIGNSGATVFLNPDTTSKFTRIPEGSQARILKKLMKVPKIKNVLVGAGHESKGIENRILAMLPESDSKKVHIIPDSMPLSAYAVLIDFADVYITGDSGPMHIAAAFKHSVSRKYAFRNKTAVFCIFGSTPAKIYGYDSHRGNYISSAQDAPSYIYISDSPCRNITCINKRAKTCRNLRCFAYLDTDRIVRDISSYVETITVL